MYVRLSRNRESEKQTALNQKQGKTGREKNLREKLLYENGAETSQRTVSILEKGSS